MSINRARKGDNNGDFRENDYNTKYFKYCNENRNCQIKQVEEECVNIMLEFYASEESLSKNDGL